MRLTSQHHNVVRRWRWPLPENRRLQEEGRTIRWAGYLAHAHSSHQSTQIASCSKYSASRSEGTVGSNVECQRLHQQGQNCQARWYERVQTRPKRTTVHTNRNPLLCQVRWRLMQPWSLEWSTLRLQVRYVVARLRNLRNDHITTTVSRGRHGRSLQESYEGGIPQDSKPVLTRTE